MRYSLWRHSTLTVSRFQGLLEIAIVSGVAAAYQLGAPYDKVDDVADDFFNHYLQKAYGKSFKRE